MGKGLIITLVIVVLLIVGGIIYFSLGTCEPYKYTFILNQKTLDNLGEDETAQNPYKISCNELKASYCLDHLEGSFNSNYITCDNKEIDISCSELVEHACKNSAGVYEKNSKTCTQKEVTLNNLLDLSKTINVGPGLISKNEIVTKAKDIPDC